MATPKSKRRILSPTQVTFAKVGDVVEGRYVGSEPVEIQGRAALRYLLETNEGLVSLNGTWRIDEAMRQAVPGDTIGIEYTGETTTLGGFKMKEFEVYAIEEA